MGAANNKIVIGQQDLFCDDQLRVLRFGSPNSQNYDGIHMKGKLGMQHMTETFVKMLTGIFPHLRKPVILMEQKQQRERQQWIEKRQQQQQEVQLQHQQRSDYTHSQQPSRTFAELFSRGKVEHSRYNKYYNSEN